MQETFNTSRGQNVQLPGGIALSIFRWSAI